MRTVFVDERKNPRATPAVPLTWLAWSFVLGLFGLYYLPYPVLLFNSFTPWKIVHHPVWFRIMDIRRALFRAETDPVPLQEISYRDLTYEKFLSMTEDLSKPLVIRRVWDVEHLQKLSSAEFWSKHYGNSTITCVDVKTEEYSACTIDELIAYHIEGKKNVYSRTNHQILYEHPELLEMLKMNLSDWIGSDPFYEVFLGFQDSGSPFHAEFTGNFQKQITGRKKWTLIPPSELLFANLHVTDDGGSLLAFKDVSWSHTAWVRYIHRYETIVEPGDVLFNPTMWIHAVENLPSPAGSRSSASKTLEMIVGSPERWLGLKYGLKTSYFLTSHLVLKKVLIKLYQKMNGVKARKTATDLLPIKDGATARAFDEYLRARAKEIKATAHG